MRMYDIIHKKREGGELTGEEIRFFVQGVTRGEIPDYQASALLMAIFFRGMTRRETGDLTLEMARSGDMVDLSPLPAPQASEPVSGSAVALMAECLYAGGTLEEASAAAKAAGFARNEVYRAGLFLRPLADD